MIMNRVGVARLQRPTQMGGDGIFSDARGRWLSVPWLKGGSQKLARLRLVISNWNLETEKMGRREALTSSRPRIPAPSCRQLNCPATIQNIGTTRSDLKVGVS